MFERHARELAMVPVGRADADGIHLAGVEQFAQRSHRAQAVLPGERFGALAYRLDDRDDFGLRVVLKGVRVAVGDLARSHDHDAHEGQSKVTTMLRNRSTVISAPGPITAVESFSSITAGPRNVASGVSAARS